MEVAWGEKITSSECGMLRWCISWKIWDIKKSPLSEAYLLTPSIQRRQATSMYVNNMKHSQKLNLTYASDEGFTRLSIWELSSLKKLVCTIYPLIKYILACLCRKIMGTPIPATWIPLYNMGYQIHNVVAQKEKISWNKLFNSCINRSAYIEKTFYYEER